MTLGENGRWFEKRKRFGRGVGRSQEMMTRSVVQVELDIDYSEPAKEQEQGHEHEEKNVLEKMFSSHTCSNSNLG